MIFIVVGNNQHRRNDDETRFFFFFNCSNKLESSTQDFVQHNIFENMINNIEEEPRRLLELILQMTICRAQVDNNHLSIDQ